MAKKNLERLEEISKLGYPENTLTDYYNIIHMLLEAKAIEAGIKTRGEGAHVELINFVSKNLPLTELENQFLQQIRELRNKIYYEGIRIDPDFIERNKTKFQTVIELLLKT